MKNTLTQISYLIALSSLLAIPAEAMPCKKQVGNLCYIISGFARSRIDADARFQKALQAMAEKLKGSGQVLIIQGARSAADQEKLVREHCRAGRSSCSGYASSRTSRHVIAIAADPWIHGQSIKPLCYAENQARVEFLGPKSAAAVYGTSKVKLDGKMQYVTGGHIDSSTGSNYTPRNCGRNEGLNGAKPLPSNASPLADAGGPVCPVVSKYLADRAAKPVAPRPKLIPAAPAGKKPPLTPASKSVPETKQSDQLIEI